MGAEYAVVSPNTEFAVRAGYKIGNEVQDLGSTAGFTAGVGVAINAGLLKYQMDYAFVPYGELGSTQRISLTVGFLPAENAVKTTKAVSPIGRETLPSSVVVPKASVKTAKAPVASQAAGNSSTALGLDLSPAPAAALSDIEKTKRSLNVFMGRVKSGMLPAIEFDKDNALASSSEKSLNQLGPVIERANQGVVVIIGYAGQDAKAAQERAKAASRYLTMNFRIEPDRITTKAGDSSNQPKNSAIGLDIVEK
jgi:outer membrane protein OmpA-like peptidoglycan-associated protein